MNHSIQNFDEKSNDEGDDNILLEEAMETEIETPDDRDTHIAELEKQVKDLKRKNLKYEVKMEAVEKILLPDQMETLTLPKDS